MNVVEKNEKWESELEKILKLYFQIWNWKTLEFNSSKPFYLHDFAVSMPLRPEREICKWLLRSHYTC